MEKQIFSDFIDKYRDAEMVVIGIGEEWNAYLEKQEYQDLLAFYAGAGGEEADIITFIEQQP